MKMEVMSNLIKSTRTDLTDFLKKRRSILHAKLNDVRQKSMRVNAELGICEMNMLFF